MRVSLSVKLSLAIILLIAISGTATGFLVDRSSSQALQKSINSKQLELSEQAMDKTDRFLYERLVSVQSLAAREQIQDFLSLPAPQRNPVTATFLEKQMDEFKNSSGAWSELTLVDTYGNLALNTNQQNLIAELTNQPSVLKVYAAAAAGQEGYSDALTIPGHLPVMLFMVPVRDQQVSTQPIVGVLVGELSWPTILEIFHDLGGSTATLINKQGVILGNNVDKSGEVAKASDKQTLLLSEQKVPDGSMVTGGIYNDKKFNVTSYAKEAGFLNYKGNGWTLALETPRGLAFRPAHNLTRSLVIIYILIFLVSIVLLLIVLSKLILQPIANLSEVINRLSRGDFSLRTTVNSRDELGTLGRGLNNMADKIQMVNKSLREKTGEARNEMQVLETILDSLPVGVMVVEAPDGKPIMMNKVGAQIIGRGAIEGADKDLYTKMYDILKEDGSPYPDDQLPLTTTLRTGEISFNDDLIFRRPDGTQVPVRAMDAPIRDAGGMITKAVSVFEDISKELELERSREEFFSIASHELRTPLTAIMGNSSMIERYYGARLPDNDVREMVGDIHESSLRLINIVNDFLDSSRLEQKHMKYEVINFNVVDVAKSVVKEYQVTGSRKKIHLGVQEPDSPLPMVRADQNRTKQVLINLIGNSMKFTENGSITVSFELESGFIKILIKDTGRGMSEEAQKLLFRKFEQTGPTVLTRDSVRGTGLGLYISKLITEQMGGSIHLESSRPNEGTTFSFQLPITPPSSDPSPDKTA